jgi:hypothetical protein
LAGPGILGNAGRPDGFADAADDAEFAIGIDEEDAVVVGGATANGTGPAATKSPPPVALNKPRPVRLMVMSLEVCKRSR